MEILKNISDLLEPVSYTHLLLELKKHDRDFYNFLKVVLSGNEKVKVERSNKIKDEAVNLNEVFLSRGNCLLNQEWRDYLKSRGIGEEHLDRLFRLGKNNNMMIPITDGKNIIAIKYRDMAKKYLYSERGSKGDYFINWQHINNRDYIIIVEGEIDLLSALESGFENVVSLPMGASDINAVKNQKNWLLEFKKIIIAMDKDCLLYTSSAQTRCIFLTSFRWGILIFTSKLRQLDVRENKSLISAKMEFGEEY